MKVVNEKGLTQIRELLEQHHVSGADMTDGNISAWAYVVESQLDLGNPPTFEIPKHYSVTGATIELELDDDCIDEIPV